MKEYTKQKRVINEVVGLYATMWTILIIVVCVLS